MWMHVVVISALRFDLGSGFVDVQEPVLVQAFQPAEIATPRALFANIFDRIDRLRPATARA